MNEASRLSRSRCSHSARLAIETLEDRSLPSTYSYLVLAQSDSSLPAYFAEKIQAAGGEVRYTVPQIGVALVDSDDRSFDNRAEQIPGIRSVVFAGLARPESSTEPQVVPPQPPLGPNALVTPDEFSPLQWNLDAIDAQAAWAQGVSGEGIRVAILDSGFMNNHPDLHFNPVLSKSMVLGQPEENWAAPDPLQVVVHGTMVAGVVGALDNGEGTVGVAPRADLVAVRLFPESITDTVDVAAAMRGIVYATDINSDVINMSFNFIYNKNGWTYDPENTPSDPSDDVVETPQDTANIVRAFQRATDYAHDHGVVVVAAAANDAVNHDAPLNDFYFPQGLPHVITVSATGPVGIANNPDTDLDVPAYYTDFGQSYIDLAAPGGNTDFELQTSGQLVTVFGVTAPAFLLDWIFTPSTDPFPEEHPDLHINAALGTSFAAPHVAAIAALVIEANGGRMDPDEVVKILRQSADDLGKPGTDDFYGAGRVNAATAVALALADRDNEDGLSHLASAAVQFDHPQAPGRPMITAIVPATGLTVSRADTVLGGFWFIGPATGGGGMHTTFGNQNGQKRIDLHTTPGFETSQPSWTGAIKAGLQTTTPTLVINPTGDTNTSRWATGTLFGMLATDEEAAWIELAHFGRIREG